MQSVFLKKTIIFIGFRTPSFEKNKTQSVECAECFALVLKFIDSIN